ncbi:MAG TPA: LUD domain-containing protein [Opitutaceae bacterium]|nr:LUD domain-containing protein [Opitutaceae bacterium]
MDDRESILSRVRGALAPLHERAALPEYDAELAVMRKLLAGRDLVEVFSERIKRVNGLALTSVAALVDYLRTNKYTRGYCDPALWPKLAPAFGTEFRIETEFDRARIDDYAFGITRAAGAVAESGTIILNDATTSRRLAALAPWVHVAVIDRATIHPDLPTAVAALGSDPNTIWVTGPSKTADVEGILIEGVHGPGQQIGLIV